MVVGGSAGPSSLYSQSQSQMQGQVAHNSSVKHHSPYPPAPPVSQFQYKTDPGSSSLPQEVPWSGTELLPTYPPVRLGKVAGIGTGGGTGVVAGLTGHQSVPYSLLSGSSAPPPKPPRTYSASASPYSAQMTAVSSYQATQNGHHTSPYTGQREEVDLDDPLHYMH
jgi:hypothetical protein